MAVVNDPGTHYPNIEDCPGPSMLEKRLKEHNLLLATNEKKDGRLSRSSKEVLVLGVSMM